MRERRMGLWISAFAWAAGLALQVACGGGGGSSPAVQAPTGLIYASNPVVYTKGESAPANTPTVTGGAATSFAVSPALPAGLALNAASGVITGTPLVLATTAPYLVTASNGGGSTSASLQLTVNDAAPSNLAYAAASAIYTKGVPIAPNTPSNVGGGVVSYSISPTLPSGLVLSASTGILSGTPALVASSTPYTVTAVNSGGTATATLTLAVQDVAPANLSYSTAVATYFRGVPIAANLPSSTGGAVTLYAVAPALPSGLSLNPATGVISGTPTVLTGMATHTVTASNSGGSASTDLSIRVMDAAPATLAYSANPAVYVKGTAIVPNVPSNTGGVITAYTVLPALPAGLALDPATGVLTGTPAVATATASYVVTGSNITGNATSVLVLTVNEPPPGTLIYSTNPASYTKGHAITPNVPSNSGGPIASFSVTPALPAGLVLDPGSGILSGTPTALAPTTAYTVTGMGVDGSPTSVALTLTVKDVAPSISYGSSSHTFTTGVPVALNPTNSGGPVVSWAISPSTLPAGLAFSTATGSIAGTPTAITPSTTFTITATNSGGSMSVSPSIRVNPPAPVITTQPTAATVYRGQTAAFTVVATGTGTLRYQWRKNGTAISGATSSSYTTPATVLADNSAAFSVVVSDPYGGSRTSSNAALTVKSGFTPTGSMNFARICHTATLLPNGKVLIAGGLHPGLGFLASCELYDPATGTFTQTGSMSSPRVSHAAVLLQNGKVYIAGGSASSSQRLSTAEIYDPTTGTFSPTGNMLIGRNNLIATVLGTGKVLVGGGYTDAPFASTAADLFDPTTDTHQATGPMNSWRNIFSATLLPDGRVLMIGGSSMVPGIDRYDPSTGGFSYAGSLTQARSWHTSTLLPNGMVFIVGGLDTTTAVISHPEIYNPITSISTPLVATALKRYNHRAVRLQDGRVLILGGRGPGATEETASAELFDPNQLSISATQSMSTPRDYCTATLLQDGSVLITGGVNGGGILRLSSCEIYK